jgi:hypothetical protein
VKCAECGAGLGGTWFSVARKLPSGAIYVTNMHVECMERVIGRPHRRKLDAALMQAGWVQETLPVGN